MKIDHKTVDHLAHLARLEFENESKEAIVNDLNRILSFVEKLNELNTDNVSPLIYMTDETNVLREDNIHKILNKKAFVLSQLHLTM